MAAAAPPPPSSERSASDAAAQQRVALLSVAAAVFLVAVKLGTGLVTGSLGLIAEAAHSGTDLVAALLTLYAVRVAVRPADEEHHYGHGKAEHLAALAESTFLVMVSGFLAWEAVDRLTADAPGDRTMAELSDDEKDAISHRGRATRALAAWLAEREARP